MSRRVVLAYSGGLDTVTILTWLIERGWEVIAFVADVGQREDFAAVAEGAKRAGAADAVIADLRRELVTDFVFPAIAGNAVYESRYLLGTALARPLIARRQVEVALARGAGAVATGRPARATTRCASSSPTPRWRRSSRSSRRGRTASSSAASAGGAISSPSCASTG